MTAAPGPNVLVEVAGVVQVVTINRPQVRNAIDAATAAEIAAAMDELDGRDDLAAGVITGAGTAFCAGMDLKAFLAGERPSTPERGFAGLVEKPPAKPLVAAVNGPAIAGGFEVVLACDLVVAADDAVFGLPEVKRGLVAAAGGLLRLPRRIPYHLAMEWALTGEYVTARRAYEVSLVNRLVARAGRAGRGGRPGRGGRREQPAGAAGDQADDRAERRLAGRRGLQPAAGDQRAGARLGGRQGGRPRLQGEAAAGLARPLTRGPTRGPGGVARGRLTPAAGSSAGASPGTRSRPPACPGCRRPG